MAHKNSILSQDPEFYSAYGYEEQEGSGTKNVFIKVLLQLLLVFSILLAIYFAFNYVSNMNVDFKKLNFWNIEKQNEPLPHKIKTEITPTETKITEKKVVFKKVEIEHIVKKVMKNFHKEKALEVSKISTTPLIKPTQVSVQEQRKNPYLSEEYLEAVKKALGKN